MGTTVDPTTALPTVAGMPGIRFRHFRGVDADIPGMAAANQAARTADGEIEPIDVEEMRATYLHLQRCDPDRDILVIEAGDEIAGYARVFWDDLIAEGIRHYFTITLLRPDIRHAEVRRASLGWAEDRSRSIAAGQRAAGGALDRTLWFGTACFDLDSAGVDLLRENGYEPVRGFASLIRPDLEAVVETPLPEGLETRPIVPDDRLMRRIWEAEVEAFSDEFGARDQSEQDYAVFLEEPGQDVSLWCIAFDGDEVAGGVRSHIKRTPDGIREGWLDPVFTRRPWRRKGVARALVAQSLIRLREHGADRAALGADRQSPNQTLTLYESSGFRVVSASTDWRKPLVFERNAATAAPAEAAR